MSSGTSFCGRGLRVISSGDKREVPERRVITFEGEVIRSEGFGGRLPRVDRRGVDTGSL
jgi:hypothetical protein